MCLFYLVAFLLAVRYRSVSKVLMALLHCQTGLSLLQNPIICRGLRVHWMSCIMFVMQMDKQLALMLFITMKVKKKVWRTMTHQFCRLWKQHFKVNKGYLKCIQHNSVSLRLHSPCFGPVGTL